MPSQPKTVIVGGVTLHLSSPDATEQGWIGQEQILRQLLACWLVVDPSDRPLAPRCSAPPGSARRRWRWPPPASASSRSTSTSAPPTPGPKTCS
jgi:hypothetical protein